MCPSVEKLTKMDLICSNFENFKKKKDVFSAFKVRKKDKIIAFLEIPGGM